MSIKTTLARSIASGTNDAWQQHRKTCAACEPAARVRAYDRLCHAGSRLLQARNDARAEAEAEAEADKQPIPGQEPLFGD